MVSPTYMVHTGHRSIEKAEEDTHGLFIDYYATLPANMSCADNGLYTSAF